MSTSSKVLREKFLIFFKSKQHHIEKSAPLIPKDDKTLLFVNAGMVQFKNVFLKKEDRPYKKAASSQKCVRAGGKHNDLENVGLTARHHTFFEMLGNFSFGDYFKEEAITFAWEFLTKELGLLKDRLSVSVFAGDEKVPFDQEAFDIWHKKIGLDKSKIKALGRKDNFWQMGDTGPCGPCSEIHYHRGNVSAGFGPNDEDEQNIELWNLVFMQYEQHKDGSLTPLPAACVDTGMGLERLTTVVNGLSSNYDTDLLRPMISVCESLTNKNYQSSDSNEDIAMRVIADHSRATAFLMADGLLPGNEGRSYVLRRIMRRAIRYGAQLGLKELFFHKACLRVIDNMKDAYSELSQARTIIEKTVMREEEIFRKTLDRGLALFYEQTKDLKPNSTLSGHVVFKLHETYGFPKDLTADLAKEKNLVIDWQEYQKEKAKHEERSAKGLGLKGIDDVLLSLKKNLNATSFINEPKINHATIIAIVKNDKEVEHLKKDEEGILVLDKTNFYGESGGQVGDSGVMKFKDGSLQVIDTKKIDNIHLHQVKVTEGMIHKGDTLEAIVDWQRRISIMRNHSATHLLHSALRKVLGTHVIQKGSLVAKDKLRFDFSHFEALSKEQITKIEDMVNEWILENEAANVQIMNMDEAKKSGALALFGEKYQEKVRVLDMGSHSRELCGGTHCKRTGDIGAFKIISEGPLAQGIRRLEAITGDYVVKHTRKNDELINKLSKKLSTRPKELLPRTEALITQYKEALKQLKKQSSVSLKDKAKDIVKKKKTINDYNFVGQVVDFIVDINDLRTYSDMIRDKLTHGIVALGLKMKGNKCILLVAATKDVADKVKAGNLVKNASSFINGKGGGRNDFAQAGGTNASGLHDALKAIEKEIEK